MTHYDEARRIIEAVCRYYEIDEAKLISLDNPRCNARARHVAIYLLWNNEKRYKNKEIGELLKRDHSTVSCSIGFKQAENYKDDINDIEKMLEEQ